MVTFSANSSILKDLTHLCGHMNLDVFKNLPSYHLPESIACETKGDVHMDPWVVLSFEEWEDASHLLFLQKILGAIKKSSDSCFCFRSDSPFYLYKYLENQDPGKRIICFGVLPATLGMNAQAHKNEWALIRGHHFLFTDLLGILNKDDIKKKHFWQALQKMFIK